MTNFNLVMPVVQQPGLSVEDYCTAQDTAIKSVPNRLDLPKEVTDHMSLIFSNRTS